jgi:amino acid transporter
MSPKIVVPRTITSLSGSLMCIGVSIGGGIFLVPGMMIHMVGSPGMVILLFILGGLVSVLGCWAFVELGLIDPVSGGEKQYLERAFPKPKYFYSFLLCQVKVWMINPGRTAAVTFAAGKFLLEGTMGSEKVIRAAGNISLADNYDWVNRAIAVGFVFIITTCHAYVPRAAIRIQDSMVILKATLLFVGIVTGIVAACGGTPAPPSGNFEDLFANSKFDANGIAMSLFKVLFVYEGWNTLNYSLSEFIDPERNFAKAAFYSVGTTTVLFIGFTISLFGVVPASALTKGSASIATQFFTRTLGSLFGSKILPILISTSAFSSAMCGVFASSRLLQQTAREGFLWDRLAKVSNFKTPATALTLHCLLTILYICGPPPGKAYEFLLDVVGYPKSIFYGLAVLGGIYMQYTQPHLPRPVKAPVIGSAFFVLFAFCMAVVPFLPPPEYKGDVPYYLSSLLGVVMIFLFVGLYYLVIAKWKRHETSIKARELAEEELERGQWQETKKTYA